MCNGGASIKEKGNNPNTVLGSVGLSETLLGWHSPGISISALSSDFIPLIASTTMADAVIDPALLVQSMSADAANENKCKTDLTDKVLVMPNKKKTR